MVLAGGAARRLGGTDKPALPVGGRSLLDRVLAACAGARTTVVVGPRRPTARPVRWTREEPAGGGPLPALAAGLAALGGPPGGVVLVLAADLPFLTAGTAGALACALGAGPAGDEEGGSGARGGSCVHDGSGARSATAAQGGSGPCSATAAQGGSGAAGRPQPSTAGADRDDREGVMLTDAGGRDQPLAAAYRIEPLRRELALLTAEHGRLSGLPLRLLTGELDLGRIADPTGQDSFDCDTWEDVAMARARLDAESEG